MRFRNNYVNPPKSKGEKNSGISMTVPDLSMSIRELINRYTHGLPISGQRVPIYEGDDTITPDFKKMDIEDIAQMALDVESRLEDSQRKAKDKKSSKKASEEVQSDVQTTSQTQNPEP